MSYLSYDFSLLIVFSFIANIVITGVCVCRLGKMTGVRRIVKIQYIGLMVLSFSNALAPLFYQQWPNFAGFLFSAWVCFMLVTDGYQWRTGAPLASKVPEQGGLPE